MSIPQLKFISSYAMKAVDIPFEIAINSGLLVIKDTRFPKMCCADDGYVSPNFCALRNPVYEVLDESFEVEVITQELTTVDKVYKNCNLELAGKSIKLNLMPLCHILMS
jgi:hypothetical protein